MLKNYTPQDLKLAYQLVQSDLFNALLTTKNGQSVRLGCLGKITKKESQQKCGWDQQNYVYCRLNFKPFSKLKTALNQQIINKYKLKT